MRSYLVATKLSCYKILTKDEKMRNFAEKLESMNRLSVLLAFVIAAIPMFAADIVIDGLYYTVTSLTDFEVSLVQPDKGVQYPQKVIIPGQIEYNGKTLKVTAIGYGAFKGQTAVEYVYIPKEVAQIYGTCFESCTSLKELVIEDSSEPIKMGYQKYSSSPGYDGPGQGLFYDCKLEKLYLGRNIDYDQSYYAYYGYSPFYNQKELYSVQIGPNVSRFGMYFFYGAKKLETLVLPEGFERFESYSLESSGITNINIPSSVSYIGRESFRSTNLVEITIPNLVESLDIYTFANCNNLSTVKLGENLKEIGNFAFESENILNVYSYSIQPPKFTTYNQLPFGTFTTKTCMNATLYVPEESVSLYQNAEGWNCFWNIKSIESAGVDEIRIDNNLPILYFDINGRQINHPSNGVFIEKQGKKLRKILIP